jgi:hypothetical protein
MTAAFALLSSFAGLGTSLMSIVFLMACGANSTPRQLRELWVMMTGIGIAAAIGLTVAIFAFITQRYGLAVAAGILPAAGCILLMVWLFWTEY